MKKLLTAVALALSITSAIAQIYTAKDGATSIMFFSESPLENIEAVNKGAAIVFKSTTGDLQVSVSIQNFKFKNALMEEHFNENYMETEKYPKAVFRGKINEPVDYTKEGETKVTVSGKLDMHGVTKDVTLSGTITKVGNDFKLYCKTKIKVADYNIKVPSMYVKNIAEVVDVTFNTTLEPFQKKQ
jgi:polyisoprenoid-binding protein YceI